MKPLLCLCFLAFFGQGKLVAGSTVLLVLVPGPKSHLFNMKKLGSEIASRGHKTAVSPKHFMRTNNQRFWRVQICLMHTK